MPSVVGTGQRVAHTFQGTVDAQQLKQVLYVVDIKESFPGWHLPVLRLQERPILVVLNNALVFCPPAPN